MKNQYFGDIRDLFKFDLCYHIYNTIKLEYFVFIPMLTDDDRSSDGSKINFSKANAGYYNDDLSFFLKYKLKYKDRDVSSIADYFNYIQVKTLVFDDKFSIRSREEYFKKAVNIIQQNSLILLDPDNGLEVKNSNEKHVLYKEINSIIRMMDEQSILMIYQHFSRENHFIFTKKKLDELQERTRLKSLFISDNDIIFFFLCKNILQQEKLKNILNTYKKNYKKLFIDTKSLQNIQGAINFD